MSEKKTGAIVAYTCFAAIFQLVLGVFEIVCSNPDSSLLRLPIWQPSFTQINPIIQATVADFMKGEGIANIVLFGIFLILAFCAINDLCFSIILYLFFAIHKIIIIFLIAFVLWGDQNTTPNDYYKTDTVSLILLVEFIYHIITISFLCGVFGGSDSSGPNVRYTGSYDVYQRIS